jgi:hypothetical protein
VGDASGSRRRPSFLVPSRSSQKLGDVGRIALVAILAVLLFAILGPVPQAYAHRSGCHRWHSCPSDTGSYVCGDLGRCSGCPDNQYCEAGKPRPAQTQTKESTRLKDQARAGVPPEDAWNCPTTHPIKGNFTTSSGESCIHHNPGGQFYGRTEPERCYATEAEARQDGCRRSKR